MIVTAYIYLSYNEREEARELNNVIVGLESLLYWTVGCCVLYYPYQGTETTSAIAGEQWRGISSSNDIDDDESSQFSGYFTVDNSIEGMKVLVNELFGITMKEVDIPLEERWDIDTTKEEAVPSKGGSDGLRKFEFHHEVEGPLRTIFYDLHPWDGKFLHAAHFTIRCGRIRNEDNTINNNSAQPTTATTSEHQLPIVALVCNLTPS